MPNSDHALWLLAIALLILSLALVLVSAGGVIAVEEMVLVPLILWVSLTAVVLLGLVRVARRGRKEDERTPDV